MIHIADHRNVIYTIEWWHDHLKRPGYFRMVIWVHGNAHMTIADNCWWMEAIRYCVVEITQNWQEWEIMNPGLGTPHDPVHSP